LRFVSFLLLYNDLLMHHLHLFCRFAESKKEVANRYYSQKQYKKALIGYNEAVGNTLYIYIYYLILYYIILYMY